MSNKVRDILKKLNIRITYENNDFARFKPPYRASSNDTVASINLKTGWVKDFSEDSSFSLDELTSRCMGRKLSADEINRYNTKVKPFLEEVETEKFPSLEKTWKKECLIHLVKNHTYWTARGIKKETLHFFKGGVAHSGPLYQRYVWPVFDKYNRIIGFTGRDIVGDKKIKYKHQGPSKKFLFGVWNENKKNERPILNSIIESKEVFITEGPSDSIACVDEGIMNVIPSFGLNISLTLINFLLAVNVEKIIICYNFDDNFRGQDALIKQYAKLADYWPLENIILATPEGNDLCENKKSLTAWSKHASLPKLSPIEIAKYKFKEKLERLKLDGKKFTIQEQKVFKRLNKYSIFDKYKKKT